MADKYPVLSTVAGAVIGAAGLLAVGTTTGTVAAGDDSRIVGAVQATTLTTNGDLFVRSGGSVTRLAAGSDGQVLTVASGAPAWATAFATGYTDDFSNASRWTLVNGNGTAAIGSGVFTATTPSGVNTQTPNRPSVSATLPSAVRGVDVAARLGSLTGTLGSPSALLALGNVADPSNSQAPSSGDFVVVVVIGADGAIVVGEIYSGGSFTPRLSSGAGVIPIDGTGWARVAVTPTAYTVLSGVGATYAAAVWTVRVTQSITWGARPLTTLGLTGYRASTDAEVHTVTWDDVTAVSR